MQFTVHSLFGFCCITTSAINFNPISCLFIQLIIHYTPYVSLFFPFVAAGHLVKFSPILFHYLHLHIMVSLNFEKEFHSQGHADTGLDKILNHY